MNDITANRHGGNVESSAAFVAIREKLPKARSFVLGIVTDAGSNGITLDQISAKTKLPPNVLSGRITELKRSSLIVDSGRRRKTRSGKSAAVYVAR